MLNSKRLLEEKLGHPVDHFAYPFGTSNEAGFREYDIAQQCGFKTAVTTLCHPLDPKQLFRLPRHAITERHSPELLRVKLSGWNAFWQKQM